MSHLWYIHHMNLEEISTLIKSRRSIYPAMYTGEKIEDHVIHSILDNANWAPSHKKTEPWRFRIFSGDSLVILSNYLGEYYSKNTSEDKFSALKLTKTKAKPIQSSHVIAICAKLGPEGYVPVWEEKAAVAMAVQNMWLTCASLQLGCYWSTPKSAIEGRDIFQLEDDEICMGLFYIGIPKKIALKVPGERGPIQNKVKWI